MRPSFWSVLALAGGIAGFAFAAVSTFDFTAHLDREVHGVHCSFLPGAPAATGDEAAGCQTTLMSPYSSVLRDRIWGGVPIALPGMSVFAFIAFWALFLVLGRRQGDRAATGFFVAAALLPVGSSIVMGTLSVKVLGAVCKLCIGMYISSAVALVGALGLAVTAASRSRSEPDSPTPLGASALALSFLVGVLFVFVPGLTYASVAPDFTDYIGNCGKLETPQDPYGLRLPLGESGRELEMLEVLDPLCSACKGFEERFSAMEVRHEVSRSALLFPLDTECNWMLGESIHPGACAVSEAMICAGDGAQEVLHWAFEHQSEVMDATRADPKAAARMVSEQFPKLASCIGSPATRAKLNHSLRWAVDNELQILTPQVYVRGLRLCDGDTDLGLDYALPRLIARASKLPKPEKLEPKPLPALKLARVPAPRANPGDASPTGAPQGGGELLPPPAPEDGTAVVAADAPPVAAGVVAAPQQPAVPGDAPPQEAPKAAAAPTAAPAPAPTAGPAPAPGDAPTAAAPPPAAPTPPAAPEPAAAPPPPEPATEEVP